MSNVPLADAFKLGLHLEYLRGIGSAAAEQRTDLSTTPYLLENQPALRFSASRVASVLKSLAEMLKAVDLPKARLAAAPLDPMREEIETFLAQSPEPDGVTLLDPFADRIVAIAEEVVKELRGEIG